MSTFFNGFEGLWRRSTADYRNAVKGYLISVDTNVLLQLYRFTPEARGELLDVLSNLRDRLWIPHQVVAEYYARRVEAVKEHLNLYSSTPKSLGEQKAKSLQELHSFAKRCSMNEDERKRLIAPLEVAYSAVNSEIERHQSEFDLTLEKVIDDDPVLTALAKIFDGKTGAPFSEEESERFTVEYERRAEERIPPGYRDAGKHENAHGDYFIWEQLLREAEVRSRPLLFVTNDTKEDWVRREAGLIVGARPELLAEFSDRCGNDFMLTQLSRFLQIAKVELGVLVSASTMAQAENIEESANVTHVKVSMPARIYATFSQILAQKYREARETAQVSSGRIARLAEEESGELFKLIKSTSSSLSSEGLDAVFRVDQRHIEIVQALMRKAANQERGTSDIQGSSRFSELHQEIQVAQEAYSSSTRRLAEAEKAAKEAELAGENEDIAQAKTALRAAVLEARQRLDQLHAMRSEEQKNVSRLEWD
ncbi:PIN domain-containing protein [Streptomyces lydicus]|uniref:PIN domain-containing protein n=1 Tax=Streptomyces lydicus TaxID=47763 RepID=UPI0037A15960